MKFDRKKFWNNYKAKINSNVTTKQIKAIEFLLGKFESDAIWSDVRHIAYAFATIHHETAYTYEPIQEYGSNSYFERRYGYQTRKGRELGNDAPGEGAKFSGKGYVQLTGESNYEKLEKIICEQNPEIVGEFESRTKQKFDLTDYAYQAKDPDIAFLIMTIGMFRGIYTGVAFRHYINERETNYREARRIINGTDKAGQIAGYADNFEVVLRAALVKETPVKDLSDEEINRAVEQNIGVPAAENPSLQAEPSEQSQPPEQPTETTYKKEVETEQGSESVQVTKPIGDAPNAEPKAWLNVEDWKPFVFRWLKRIWSGFSGTNFAQITGLSTGAFSDPPNWFIYAAIGLAIFFMTLIVVLIISGVLLLIWYFNRKEIKEYKTLEHESKINPNAFNLGLNFEKV